MKVTRSINSVDETIGCTSLSWSAADELDYSLKQASGSLKRGDLSVRQLFGLDHLETLQDFVSVMRENRAMGPLSESIP